MLPIKLRLRKLFSFGKTLLCSFLLLVTYHLSLVANAEAAKIEYSDGLPVIYLSGTPYEIGQQHGKLLQKEVRSSVRRVLGYFRDYLKVPLVDVLFANWWLDDAWKKSKPFISRDFLDELRGLSDGSGVSLRDLYRLHAVADRTYACSSFAAWGRATKKGQLIHIRNLDWNIGVGIQNYAAIFVVRPPGKHAFVSAGWAGFIGVLSGVNDSQISIGQIGAETTDATFRGELMPFVIRRVLEESDNLDEAAAIIRDAHRTVGINYVVADAKAKNAIALETTRSLFRIFKSDDPQEHLVSYAKPISCAVLRADTAIDPAIRNRQIASNGNPQKKGLETPSGSSAYDARYLGQAAGILAHFGSLDELSARAIAQAVAQDSNIQSVIIAWPKLFVSNAHDAIPASKSSYHEFNLRKLFEPPR